MDFSKKFLIAGTGKSGICSAKLLQKMGAQIMFYDGKTDLNVEDVLSKLDDRENVGIVLGTVNDEILSTIDVMIISPGISIESELAKQVSEKNIPIWSEIELAYRAGAGKVAAITGTNGKTTTTSLVGEILKKHTSNSFVVGNIGLPYTDAALDTNEESFIALEVSSFQLEAVEEFCPKVSAVLNVTPDHLDRHHTMENYASVKLDICRNQTANDYIVLNYDDPITREMAHDPRVKAKVVYFSGVDKLEDGVCLDGDEIVIVDKGQKISVIDRSKLILLGQHNLENYMAGIAVAYYMGVPVAEITDVLKTFKGVEHRIEFVEEVNGVTYYNDSKGTNPDAAIKGIQAMNRKTVLIGGGYDKGVPFDDWIKAFDGKVKKLVLIGQTAKLIADTAEKYGFTDYVFADSLEEAVKICADEAEPGEAVLLSPACASWGMFENYEQRGDQFKELVRKMM